MRHRAGMFAVLWVVGACGCATPGQHVFDAHRLEPEEWYRVLHVAMERCLGKKRDYDKIEWYVTRPGVMGQVGEMPVNTGTVAGLWSSPNRIYLDQRFVMSEAVIRHELGHYILQWGGDHHADSLFVKCTS